MGVHKWCVTSHAEVPTDPRTVQSASDRSAYGTTVLSEKMRSYGIDNVEMPSHTRIAVEQRLDAFRHDVLSVSDEDLDERMRAVATHALRIPPDVVAALNAEKKYRSAMKHWDAYQSWKSHRNPARAALEREHGYDTKHAMHLIRLMRMGIEVLESGELHVRRHDAEELLAIRDGAMTFEDLMTSAEELKARMEQAASAARLPVEVDQDAADALLLELATSH